MIWLGIVSVLFMIFSFYFTLTFIENLHRSETERVIKQSKSAAVICFGIALVVSLFGVLVISYFEE